MDGGFFFFCVCVCVCVRDFFLLQGPEAILVSDNIFLLRN